MRLRRRTRRLGYLSLAFLLAFTALVCLINAVSQRDIRLENVSSSTSDGSTEFGGVRKAARIASSASRALHALVTFGDENGSFAIESPDEFAADGAQEIDLDGKHRDSSLDVVFAVHANSTVRGPNYPGNGYAGFGATGPSRNGQPGYSAPAFAHTGVTDGGTTGGGTIPSNPQADNGSTPNNGNAAANGSTPDNGGAPNNGNGLNNGSPAGEQLAGNGNGPGAGAGTGTGNIGDNGQHDAGAGHDNGAGAGNGNGAGNGAGGGNGSGAASGDNPGAPGHQGGNAFPNQGTGTPPGNGNGGGNGNGNNNLAPGGTPANGDQPGRDHPPGHMDDGLHPGSDGGVTPGQPLPAQGADVPEPASIALMLTGLGLLGLRRRKAGARQGSSAGFAF